MQIELIPTALPCKFTQVNACLYAPTRGYLLTSQCQCTNEWHIELALVSQATPVINANILET